LLSNGTVLKNESYPDPVGDYSTYALDLIQFSITEVPGYVILTYNFTKPTNSSSTSPPQNWAEFLLIFNNYNVSGSPTYIIELSTYDGGRSRWTELSSGSWNDFSSGELVWNELTNTTLVVSINRVFFTSKGFLGNIIMSFYVEAEWNVDQWTRATTDKIGGAGDEKSYKFYYSKPSINILTYYTKANIGDNLLLKIRYTDLDGDSPDYVLMSVNSVNLSMYKENVYDNEYYDGVTYYRYYYINRSGIITIRFIGSDGISETTVRMDIFVESKENWLYVITVFVIVSIVAVAVFFIFRYYKKKKGQLIIIK